MLTKRRGLNRRLQTFIAAQVPSTVPAGGFFTGQPRESSIPAVMPMASLPNCPVRAHASCPARTLAAFLRWSAAYDSAQRLIPRWWRRLVLAPLRMIAKWLAHECAPNWANAEAEGLPTWCRCGLIIGFSDGRATRRLLSTALEMGAAPGARAVRPSCVFSHTRR